MQRMSAAPKESAYGITPAKWDEICTARGIPSYRARQIREWLYCHTAREWGEMTTLPAVDRERLAETHPITRPEIVKTEGPPGGTAKLVIRFDDGDCVETVLIPAQGRRTLCVSSQAGCKFGCVFCASGQAGFKRNLSTAEIIMQIMLAHGIWNAYPTHLVFMGIGEPFDNYEAVLNAVRIVNDAQGIDIGARRITISTVGVLTGIERLMQENLQVELSISLHAPNDAVRSSLMPINRRYGLDALFDMCARYTSATKRIITFEYTLISGVNDSREHAAELAARLSRFSCRVNLIRLNPIEEYRAEACPAQTGKMFTRILAERGINATYRDSRGRSVNAACGQLRLRSMMDETPSHKKQRSQRAVIASPSP